jgi:hypothetical protein
MILFLIEQGAKLQNKPPRFDEKQRAQNKFQQVLNKIDQLEDIRKEKIKQQIINIRYKV